jgi:hypothetical protein
VIFTRPSGASPVLLALAGYAVLNDATMPVVGDPETVNNTYLEQVADSARAAIDGLTRDVDEECQRYPLPTPDRVIHYGITRPSKHARIRCCLLLPRS